VSCAAYREKFGDTLDEPDYDRLQPVQVLRRPDLQLLCQAVVSLLSCVIRC
jgi:hypothetical protein